MIEVDSLVKSFKDPKRGTITAVDGLTFQAHGGEIFGLLGSNGAGKTTTLRMLATILKPSGGVARVAGYDVSREPANVRKSIGFLSGDMGYYHRLTPREVLRVFGQLNGLSGARLKERIAYLIESLGMQSYADSRADTFSTGMRQRLAVARTLLHDPPVLILDEPTAGLDVSTAQIIEGFILEAKQSGKCVVLSTHIMEEAEYLCDRIAVIDRGRLEALGTIEELRAITGKQRLREVFLALIHQQTGAEGARV